MSKFDNYTLNGEYKVDVYSKENELVNSTDYFHNFITSTGLSYPRVTGFADCFYYLSLGSGNATNSVLTTTGLQSPIPNYQYLSTDHFLKEGFGTTETLSGLSLYRAWRIPDTGSLFAKNFSFSELMTSPSTGDDLQYAFSRVVKNPEISLVAEQYAIINYRLNLTTNTGLNYFKNVITLKTPTTEFNSHIGWQALSGAQSQVHHGIKMIDWERNDHDNDPPGVSFTPPFGRPLEPSTTATYYVGAEETERKLFCYLSDNNTQFMLNEASGGALNTGLYKPWNTGAAFFSPGVSGVPRLPGVVKYQYGLSEEDPAEGSYVKRLYNLRKESINPLMGDFSKEAKETSATRLDGIVEIGKDHNYSYADRSRYVTRKLSWLPNNVQYDENSDFQRYKSMVFGDACFGSLETIYYPSLDILYGTSSGNSIPPINTGSLTINSTTGAYPFPDDRNVLSMSFKLSWCAPCDGADDCDEGTNNCC